MQIAKVVPKANTKSSNVFDYAIPPEILPQTQIGVLVKIPFHGREIEGIIIDLKKTSNILKLKSILEIIDPVPVVNQLHIELAKWMTEYYLAPLGKTLFENIVPPAIRAIKKNEETQIPKHAILRSNKNILIVGNFTQRLKLYKEAIRKTIAGGRAAIIIVPDLSLIDPIIHEFKNYTLLHSEMTKTKRWEAWNNIRNSKIQLVIGSTSALFAPLPNLGLVIVDQEEDETYKNDRSPRFHARDVALALGRLGHINVILGSITPKTETYELAQNNKLVLKEFKTAESEIKIVDMSRERSILSEPLTKEIEKVLQKDGRILLFYDRKGSRPRFACAQCDWISSENTPVTNCPECKGIKIKPIGFSTKKLIALIKSRWPDQNAILVEKESEFNLASKWNFAISTSFGLKFVWPEIDLVGIIDADMDSNLPDFSSRERNFQKLFKFLSITTRGIIQTHQAESRFISALSSLDYKVFFTNEIAERKKYHYPPFTKLIKLITQNQDRSLAQKEIEEIFENLKSYTDTDTEILEPQELYQKIGAPMHRFQILVKTNAKGNSELKSRIKNLENIIIDVDPISTT